MEIRRHAPSGTPTVRPIAVGATSSARFALVMLVSADALAIVGLHRLGNADWASAAWFDSATWTSRAPEAVVTAALRTVALGLAYWVALTVLAGVVTSRRSRPNDSHHWSTLPVIRHLVERALAVGLAASTVTAPAVAAATEQPPIPVIVEMSTDASSTVQPSAEWAHVAGPKPASASGEEPLPRPGPPATSVSGSATATMSPQVHRIAQTATTRTVEPGDNMWLIAERHLAAHRSSITDADVATYWVQVIDANRNTIRSGDPDLIYPGEMLILPAVRP